MPPILSKSEKLEQRAVIKFLQKTGSKPADTIKEFKTVYGDRRLSNRTVYKWYKRFGSEGRTEVDDKKRCGRPERRDVHFVEEMIEQDNRMSVRGISKALGIPKSSVYDILKKDLHLKKVATRWVPYSLSADQMQKRVDISEAFLERYRREGDGFLDRLITTDEAWVYFYQPPYPHMGGEWLPEGACDDTRTEAKMWQNGEKRMIITFLSRRCLVLCHFVPAGTSVNAEYYSKVSNKHNTVTTKCLCSSTHLIDFNFINAL